MITANNDDLFTPEVTADPYPYFDRLREEDPVHWNEKSGVWIITRYDDVVWLLRHPELFSSEVFNRDPREPYPPMVQSAITELLDEAEAQGRMDVMRDFATPLPLLLIAQMLGMPY